MVGLLATVRHSSSALSSAVTAAWALWASNGKGRNRMVTVAYGSPSSEVLVEGAWKPDPPPLVRRALSASTEFTPSAGSMPLSSRYRWIWPSRTTATPSRTARPNSFMTAPSTPSRLGGLASR
jgi:hypothetical protein